MEAIEEAKEQKTVYIEVSDGEDDERKIEYVVVRDSGDEDVPTPPASPSLEWHHTSYADVLGPGYEPWISDNSSGDNDINDDDVPTPPSTPPCNPHYTFDGGMMGHGHQPPWGPVLPYAEQNTTDCIESSNDNNAPPPPTPPWNPHYTFDGGMMEHEHEPACGPVLPGGAQNTTDAIYSSDDDEDTKLGDLYPELFNRQNQAEPQAAAADTGSAAASDSVGQVHANVVIEKVRKFLVGLRAGQEFPMSKGRTMCTVANKESPWHLEFSIGKNLIRCRPNNAMRLILTTLQQFRPWSGKKGRCKAISFKGSFRVANNARNKAVAEGILDMLDSLCEEYEGCTITNEESLAPKETVLTADDSIEGRAVQRMTAAYSGPQIRLLLNDKHGSVPYFKMNGVSPLVTDAVLSQLKESELDYARFIVPYMIARGIKGSNTVTVDERFVTGTVCCGLIGLAHHAMLLYSQNGTDYFVGDPWKQTIARRNDSNQLAALTDWFLKRGCTLTFLPGKVIQGAEGACVVAALTKMLNAARAMHSGGDVRAMATGRHEDGKEVHDYVQLSGNSAVLAQRLIYMEKYRK